MHKSIETFQRDMSPQYWTPSIGGTYQVLRAFFAFIAQSVLRTAFPMLSICLAIMLSSSCVIVAQFATR